MYYRIFSKFYRIGSRGMVSAAKGFINKGNRVLDVGCGSGIIGKAFGDAFGCKVVGVDIMDGRLVDIPFELIDGKRIGFGDKSFDISLVNFVLHHAEDQIALLQEVKRVTKDKIIICEDVPTGWLSRLICFLHGLSFNVLAQDGRDRGSFRGLDEWRSLFKELDLKIIAEKRISSVFHPVCKIMFILRV